MNLQPSASLAPAIVVGIVRDQPDEDLIRAAELAVKLGVNLVCANVDVTRYTVEELPDGRVSAFPFDPDTDGLAVEEFDAWLAERVERVLSDTGVRWSVRELAGEPAHELAHLADKVDAPLIIVGSRHPGVRSAPVGARWVSPTSGGVQDPTGLRCR